MVRHDRITLRAPQFSHDHEFPPSVHERVPIVTDIPRASADKRVRGTHVPAIPCCLVEEAFVYKALSCFNLLIQVTVE